MLLYIPNHFIFSKEGPTIHSVIPSIQSRAEHFTRIPTSAEDVKWFMNGDAVKHKLEWQKREGSPIQNIVFSLFFLLLTLFSLFHITNRKSSHQMGSSCSVRFSLIVLFYHTNLGAFAWLLLRRLHCPVPSRSSRDKVPV